MSLAKHRLFVVLYCILILSVSTIPGEALLHLKLLGWDKLMHLLEYSVLGWLLIHSVLHRRQKVVFAVLAGGMIFGALDETWQHFISERYASVLDWLADSAGVILGATAGHFVIKRKSSSRPEPGELKK